MKTMASPRRHRFVSWLIGLLVLCGLGWTLITLFTERPGRGVEAAMPEISAPLPVTTALAGGVDGAEMPPVAIPSAPVQPVVRRLGGIVREPGGGPAVGATVSIHRALTAEPEWRFERIDQAITGSDGRFVFGLPVRYGVLVEFEHPSFAGGFFEVSNLRNELELQLEPGFELGGIVTSDVGVPISGVRVAAESPIDQQRRVEVAVTTANGGYRFINQPAGLVRLVARHERWQAVATTVRVGETSQNDIRFVMAASAPLRGRVVSVTQIPLAGAVVDLMPTNAVGRLGLVDPITAATDAEGQFMLPGLSRGPMHLQVRHPEYGMASRTVSVGAMSGMLVLELPGRSEVRGLLQRPADADLEVGGVALRLIHLRSGEIQHVVTAHDGSFELARRMPPGKASVALLGGGLAFESSRSSEQSRTDLVFPVVSPVAVRGRCVDDSGRGLAGVEVYGSESLVTRYVGNNLASLLGSVGEQVAQTLGSDRRELLAISGEDGAFEFAGQAPGPLLVRFELPGWASRRLRVSVPAAGLLEEIGDFVMSPGCRVMGAVRRGQRGLPGVRVAIIGDESQTEVMTGGGGRFEVADLMPGQYRVRARMPSMPSGRAQQVVEAMPDAESMVLLELPPGRVVNGVVTDAGGQPVANAVVLVRGAGGQPTLTDFDGSFSLELPARIVQLQVSLGDDTRTAIETVMPGAQNIAIRLDAPPTCTLIAQIAGLPGRQRVPAVLMRLRRIVGDDVGFERSRWVDVQNGVLRWPLCPVGQCRIEIRCEGYVPFVTERQLVANRDHDLGEILLEPGARVRGVVSDSSGRPVANAQVFLGDESELGILETKVRSSVDGVFEIGGVSTRSATLVVHAPGFAPVVRELVLPGDVLGDELIQLSLQPGSVISVQVNDAPDAGLVQLLRNGRLLGSSVIDDGGRAEFIDHGPGTYQVRLYGSGIPPQVVRVVSPGEVVQVTLD